MVHVCPDAGKWRNVLLLCELVFSLPYSNAKIERIFSTLKVVKSNRRTSLHTSTLDDLEISIEGPPLEEFSPMSAVELWWSSCKSIGSPVPLLRSPMTQGRRRLSQHLLYRTGFFSKDDTANSE